MKFMLLVLCVLFFGDDYLVSTHELDLTDTTPEEVPFHAVVHAKMVCDGILIAEHYVVTPAYCVYGSSSAKVYVGFRGYPYYVSHHSEPNTQILHSSDIYIHKDFTKVKDQHYLNNIAIIKLSSPAILNKKIQLGKIISRPEAQLLEGRHADVSGWLVSVDEDIKIATVQIRNKDTCNYLFGDQFLRSQQFCVKWSTKTRLNLLGNPVRVDNKIIGFQTNTPRCEVASSTCTRNDMILSFMPFLDWMSHTMNISVEAFTTASREVTQNHDLAKIKDLINEINDNIAKDRSNYKKYEDDIADLKEKIKNITVELQKTKTEQSNFALSLNEQISNIKSEIVNSNTKINQNVFNLQEELNSVKTEVSNGLSAQKSLSGFEARFNNLTNAVQNGMDEQLNKIEEQIKELANKTKNNQIEESQHFLQLTQEIAGLRKTLHELDDKQLIYGNILEQKFEDINTTFKDVSSSQKTLHSQIDDIQGELQLHVSKAKVILTKLEEEQEKIAKTVEHNEVKENIRLDEIEMAFGEQRNDMDIHVIKEIKEIQSLWAEIKSLNDSVKKVTHFIYEEPIPN